MKHWLAKPKRNCEKYKTFFEAFKAFAEEENLEGIDFGEGDHGIVDSASPYQMQRFALWSYNVSE